MAPTSVFRIVALSILGLWAALFGYATPAWAETEAETAAQTATETDDLDDALFGDDPDPANRDDDAPFDPDPTGDIPLPDPTPGPVAAATLTPLPSPGPPPAFWALASVTGVGLVSGTVFGISVLRDERDYKKHRSPATKESGQRNAIIANISFGVAAGAAIAGTIVLIADKRQRRKRAGQTAEARPFHIAPAVAADGGALWSTWHF